MLINLTFSRETRPNLNGNASNLSALICGSIFDNDYGSKHERVVHKGETNWSTFVSTAIDL